MKIRTLLLAGSVTFAVLGMPVMAHAAEDYVGPKNEGVLGTDISRAAPAAAAPASTSAGLPVTGGDIAGLTAIGLAAVGSGTVLVRRSRRRTTTA
jgi:LPXTG-motif cell wall-anchored protein